PRARPPGVRDEGGAVLAPRRPATLPRPAPGRPRPPRPRTPLRPGPERHPGRPGSRRLPQRPLYPALPCPARPPGLRPAPAPRRGGRSMNDVLRIDIERYLAGAMSLDEKKQFFAAV